MGRARARKGTANGRWGWMGSGGRGHLGYDEVMGHEDRWLGRGENRVMLSEGEAGSQGCREDSEMTS